MVSYRYALTNEDFVNFNLYVQLDAPGKKKMIFKRYRPFIIFFAIVCIFNTSVAFANNRVDLNSLLPLIIILALVLLPYVMTRPQIKKAALRFAKNPENASVFNMTDYTFSETGILVKDEIKETRFLWNAIIKKQENSGYIFLFLNSVNTIIIPKRIFRSPVEKEELEKLFARFISFHAEVGHMVKS